MPETASLNTQVVRVVATGGAGTIRYSITNGNVGGAFRIGGGTGLVRVNAALDFETRSSYTLTINAESVGTTVQGDFTLRITVQDVNEPHEFVTLCALDPNPCQFRINENVAGGENLGRVYASDPDASTSPNGTLAYSISNPRLPFSVDAMGNIRTTQSLDREERDTYSFMLVVRDGCVGGCSLTRETAIQVSVNDLNDNAPVFTLNPDTVELSEDAADDAIVAQYIATDADIGTNAVITFSLAPNTFPFSLNQNGILTLTGSIDFETTQSYTVTITASNAGTNLATSTETTIQILNVNDNTPAFVGAPYSGTVVENSPASTSLLQVSAVDADLGIHGEIRYFITGGNFNDSFMIGQIDGQISVRNNIDRETISSFNLAVEVRDRGTPQQKKSRTIIPVSVVDENDNAPVFQPDSFSVQLREDLPVGEDVVQVVASDADLPNTPNSNIVYSIRSGNAQNRFVINPNDGQVRIQNPLDFETTTSYNLIVEGRDEGTPVMTGTASISIAILNINENPPTLTGDQVVEISEAAPVNTQVAIFDALDPDQMAVTFSISDGNSEGKFTIGASSGAITLASSLDYEMTTRYVLRIGASDGQQSTFADLTVIVLDENEFSPEFFGPTAFSIVEEQPAGITVGTVSARDADRDAVVTYSFVQQDRATNLFLLDPASGEITTRDVLDREQLTQIFAPPISMVTVQISARDNGSPSMRNVRDYSITLEDINDNSPVFSDASYSNMILENLEGEQNAFDAVATDADLGSNAELSYSFTLSNNLGSTNPFRIDSSSGTVTVTSPLDCEQQPFYLFSITATDMGSTPRASTVIGNLTVIDVNDNSPIFDQPVYRTSISEDTIPMTDIQTVRATDADKGLNGEVEYTIISSFDFTLSLETSLIRTTFEVGRSTGILRNLNEFDFESVSQINITVFANDRGIPQRSSSTLVIIDIQNIDEQAPIFFSQCDALVSEGIPVGAFVTTCVARDLDTIAIGNQPPIAYALNPPSSFFQIDPVTADITTTGSLDREISSGMSVMVEATDLAGKVTTQRAVIRLTDINDNAPSFLNTPYAFLYSGSAVLQLQNFLTVSADDPDSGFNGTVSYSVGNVDQISSTSTQVEVIATDMGSPASLSNSTIVSVTFERPCQLQEYAISASTGELSASLLCSVDVMPTSVPLVLGERNALTCIMATNTPVTYQWLQNSTTITAPQLVTNGVTEVMVRFTLSNIRFSDAGEYACKASTTAGSLQTPETTAFILGK